MDAPSVSVSPICGNCRWPAAICALPPTLAAELAHAAILIVDDLEVNRSFIERVLCREGFQNIHMAASARDALRWMQRRLPDLLILDLIMPEMNGLECCAAVRALPGGGDLPILIETVATEPELRVAAFTHGATDVVTKPILPAELAARARVLLQHRLAHKNLLSYQERLVQELDAARAMQLSALPRAESLQDIAQKTGLDIAGHVRLSSEIGGDLWGAQRLDDGRCAIWLTDFSGHGVAAALHAFQMPALLADSAAPLGNPSACLHFLNVRLRALLPRGQFATFFYGLFDPCARILHYAAAGSPAPLRVRADGVAEWLDTAGLPLGIAETTYPARQLHMQGGDTLLLYSDALLETPGQDGVCLDAERLGAWFPHSPRTGSAAAQLEHLALLFSTLYAPGQRDDLTLCLLRVLEDHHAG